MTNCTTNIKILPISFTISQFERFKINISQFEWSIFLESADVEHVDSHWSIISAAPIATLQSTSGQTIFKQGDIVEQNTIDPLILLNEKRLAIFGQPESSEKLPFVGGVLGSINYELGYQLESINHFNKPMTLSLPELSLGFYDWALLYNHQQSQFSLVTHRTPGCKYSVQSHWQDRFDWLMNIANKEQQDQQDERFMLLNDWKSNMDKQQYSDKFDKIQSYILNGDCYQVNLAQRFNAQYTGDEYQAYQALLIDNRPPFAAFLRLPEQVILSLSPERFLKLHNNFINNVNSSNNQARIVESKPIKGTRQRFTDAKLDKQSIQALQQSEKDRSENLMIVDLLRNDIGKVCQPGSVNVPSLFEIESFPAVHHLVSTVKGQLVEGCQVEDLLRACFPGGSITGAPKIRAMEIIAELEPHRRQSYCGSIGYISATGEMDMNIAIRTLICVEGEIYCWAGGGLVADSQVDAEYQECFDKVSKILPCLINLNSK
jgi:para-aminobenzoate synthetase component 1